MNVWIWISKRVWHVPSSPAGWRLDIPQTTMEKLSIQVLVPLLLGCWYSFRKAHMLPHTCLMVINRKSLLARTCRQMQHRETEGNHTSSKPSHGLQKASKYEILHCSSLFFNNFRENTFLYSSVFTQPYDSLIFDEWGSKTGFCWLTFLF